MSSKNRVRDILGVRYNSGQIDRILAVTSSSGPLLSPRKPHPELLYYLTTSPVDSEELIQFLESTQWKSPKQILLSAPEWGPSKELFKEKNAIKRAETEVEEGFTCRFCKTDSAIRLREAQTRSADEQGTQMFFCTVCQLPYAG